MKALIAFLMIILIFALGCTEQVQNTDTPEKPIGGDKDDYGCLVGAGYSWCPSTQKCQRMWEEYCAEYADNYRGNETVNNNTTVAVENKSTEQVKPSAPVEYPPFMTSIFYHNNLGKNITAMGCIAMQCPSFSGAKVPQDCIFGIKMDKFYELRTGNPVLFKEEMYNLTKEKKDCSLVGVTGIPKYVGTCSAETESCVPWRAMTVFNYTIIK